MNVKGKRQTAAMVDQRQFEDALKVARMYYHLGMTTADIGRQLGVARPTVSRLLSWARDNGLVEFRILDHRRRQLELEHVIESKYGARDVKVVPAPPHASVAERQILVARFAAHHLNSLLGVGMTLGIAWGATVSLIAQHLIPKPMRGMTVVQINGSGNTGHGVTYAADIVSAFADNYDARAMLMPVPAFFDDPRTKEAMFRERSIRRVREAADAADVVVFSIGVPDANSYIYGAGYVEDRDLADIQRQGAVGDIATVFFRSDGSYQDLSMNERSSGPELNRLAVDRNAICVVAGEQKVHAVRGALAGGFITTLVIDDASAMRLAYGLDAHAPATAS
jgi:DNA-binding transcriptional regulator LsrR (DeoR family)